MEGKLPISKEDEETCKVRMLEPKTKWKRWRGKQRAGSYSLQGNTVRDRRPPQGGMVSGRSRGMYFKGGDGNLEATGTGGRTPGLPATSWPAIRCQERPLLLEDHPSLAPFSVPTTTMSLSAPFYHCPC